MLPTFLVIGAAKSGSTSLYHYLSSHPDVFMAEQKELDFFIAEGAWSRGLEWYESHFAPAGRALARGEASPRYAIAPHYVGVPARVASVLDDVRLVYIVRDPIRRLVSQYENRLRRGVEHEPPGRALREGSFYVDGSRYAFQVEQYLEYFPEDRLLVVVSEELRRRRLGVMQEIYTFLGVDPAWASRQPALEYNVTRTKGRPRALTGRALALPLSRSLGQRVPARIRAAGRRLTHERSPEVVLAPQHEEELRALLHEDVRRLRRYVRGEFDGWGIG